MKWIRKSPYFIAYMVLGVTTLPILLMYIWLLLNSFSGEMKYGFIPVHFTLENWSFLWSNIKQGSTVFPSIWTATLNSFFFSGMLTLFEVIIGLMAGYALARLNFPGRQRLMQVTLLLHAFPSVALLIAVFYILNFLGLYDTLWGVILVKTALQVPMTAWIIKGFFDEVPWDVEWAGLIDGCSRLKVWHQVVLPLVKPGIAAVTIFSFLSGWSEFLLLYSFIVSDNNVTLSAYLSKLISDPNLINYRVLSAVSLFYMLPIIVLFITTQKSLLQVSAGGGKRV